MIPLFQLYNKQYKSSVRKVETISPRLKLKKVRGILSFEQLNHLQHVEHNLNENYFLSRLHFDINMTHLLALTGIFIVLLRNFQNVFLLNLFYADIHIAMSVRVNYNFLNTSSYIFSITG
jgi:hypothetical protein